MLADEPRRPRLRVVASEESTVRDIMDRHGVVHGAHDLQRLPLPDPGVVLAVCVPFWAGVAWLVSAWV
jgi:hypothetical protein